MVTPIEEEVLLDLDFPNLSILNCNLIINYIYLDIDERQIFINNNHQYLITQLEYSGEKRIKNFNCKIELPFINLSKEIYIICQYDIIKNGYFKQYFNYTDKINYKGNNIIKYITLLFNNQIRSNEEDKYIYNYLFNYLYHKNKLIEGINVYSFSLNPNNVIQPYGACNLSKVENIKLNLDLNYNKLLNDLLINVYSLNYNILKISNGIASLLFN